MRGRAVALMILCLAVICFSFLHNLNSIMHKCQIYSSFARSSRKLVTHYHLHKLLGLYFYPSNLDLTSIVHLLSNIERWIRILD